MNKRLVLDEGTYKVGYVPDMDNPYDKLLYDPKNIERRKEIEAEKELEKEREKNGYYIDDDGIFVITSDDAKIVKQDRKDVKIVEFENGITKIAPYAFYHCVNLTDISLPRGIISIGKGAFDNCVGITDITFRSSLKSIGSGAFSGCIGLKEVKLNNGLEKLGFAVFEKCKNLVSIHIPDTVGFDFDVSPTGNIGLLSWCPNLKTVYYNGNNRHILYYLEKRLKQNVRIIK